MMKVTKKDLKPILPGDKLLKKATETKRERAIRELVEEKIHTEVVQDQMADAMEKYEQEN